MAKRKQLLPWPDEVWHASGRVRHTTALDAIRDGIDDGIDSGAIAQGRAFFPEGEHWWWGVDAAWQTKDGDRISARLLLAPDLFIAEREGLRRHSPDVAAIDMDLSWTLTAEADRPWQLGWKSPVDVMFGGLTTFDWVSGQLYLMEESSEVSLNAERLAQQFEELSACPWYIPVVTHDKRPMEEATQRPGLALAELVPPSLRGRVVEYRVYGDQDQIVNADGVLPESRLRLKWGGALILPPKPRHDEWPMADCIVRRPPGGTFDQLLKETANVVAQYASLSPHFCDRARAGVENLRKTWVLSEIPMASKRVLEEKRQAEERVGELEHELAELRATVEGERAASQRAESARAAAEARLQELDRHPLTEQARQFRAYAEEAWSAQETAEVEVERLTGEVGWLRRQLAQVPGRAYAEPVPERPGGPDSWLELFELAAELLPRVRILESAREGVKPLRGNAAEKTWLRRTWEALEAYQAYAEAASEHGTDVLPHMQAYLRWQQATVVFPESWYASKDTVVLRREAKYAAMRTFTVPDVGPVMMGEHVRVGTGRPPSPRMHVWDDVRGETGLVHVGYIGPHLPNGRDPH
jgi:hypothetical protein